jgi:hypothetical protein
MNGPNTETWHWDQTQTLSIEIKQRQTLHELLCSVYFGKIDMLRFIQAIWQTVCAHKSNWYVWHPKSMP